MPGARSGSRVSGIAKGVGMIHPQMATMLSVVLTDATVAPEVLWALLRPAAARTWNQLSVDGDTSTNDTVFVLASGASAAAPAGGWFRGCRRPRRRHRGRRTRPGTPAGGRWRRGEHAHHGVGHGRAGRRRGAGRRARGRLVEPGQGGGPRPRPELGSHRRRGRERPPGRSRPCSRRRACRRTRRRPVPAPRPCSTPTELRISIAGHLVFDGRRGGPVAFDRVAAREAMSRAGSRLRPGPRSGHRPWRGASAAT